MSAAQAIRRLGFRKWYERELLQSHANLVLLLLATLGLLGSAEVYDAHMAFGEQLQVLLGAVASGAIGYFALRRYLYLLNHAEYVAEQAACSRCHTYARWDLVKEESAGTVLTVRCRKCSHEWDIRL